jgi:hypothetical protein
MQSQLQAIEKQRNLAKGFQPNQPMESDEDEKENDEDDHQRPFLEEEEEEEDELDD